MALAPGLGVLLPATAPPLSPPFFTGALPEVTGSAPCPSAFPIDIPALARSLPGERGYEGYITVTAVVGAAVVSLSEVYTQAARYNPAAVA